MSSCIDAKNRPRLAQRGMMPNEGYDLDIISEHA
jgi:hypothetical protein